MGPSICALIHDRREALAFLSTTTILSSAFFFLHASLLLPPPPTLPPPVYAQAVWRIVKNRRTRVFGVCRRLSRVRHHQGGPTSFSFLVFILFFIFIFVFLFYFFFDYFFERRPPIHVSRSQVSVT